MATPQSRPSRFSAIALGRQQGAGIGGDARQTGRPGAARRRRPEPRTSRRDRAPARRAGRRRGRRRRPLLRLAKRAVSRAPASMVAAEVMSPARPRSSASAARTTGSISRSGSGSIMVGVRPLRTPARTRATTRLRIGAAGLRAVGAEVGAAALAAGERAFGDQPRGDQRQGAAVAPLPAGRSRRRGAQGRPHRAPRRRPRLIARRKRLQRSVWQVRRGFGGRRRGARIGGQGRGAAGAGAEHGRLQQRVGGQPVRAMRAGRSAFAGRVEPGQRRAAGQVRLDPAHVVVHRRRRPGSAGGAGRGRRPSPRRTRPGTRAGRPRRSLARASRKAPRPARRSAAIARATTSRGASSAARW